MREMIKNKERGRKRGEQREEEWTREKEEKRKVGTEEQDWKTGEWEQVEMDRTGSKLVNEITTMCALGKGHHNDTERLLRKQEERKRNEYVRNGVEGPAPRRHLGLDSVLH